jgi:hypothetical protein
MTGFFMRLAAVASVIAALFGGLVTPGMAADGPHWRPHNIVYQLPFSRSDRAQSVWESGACWSECGSQCAWRQSACLRPDGPVPQATQGQCVAYTDACDRYCQKLCRSSGGPLLDITD